MRPFSTFLSLLILLTLTVVDAGLVGRATRNPTLKFQVVTKFNKDHARNYTERDRARARDLIKADRRESASVKNRLVTYTAEIGVGSPPTYYTLCLDTGSSVTWVGSGKEYVQTSTSQDTGYAFDTMYGRGGSSGELWNDTVTLAPGLVVKEQIIGVAAESSGTLYDGILGLGPVDLTRGIVSVGYSPVDTIIPTVMDNLLAQGDISQEVIGIYFTPYNCGKRGELTLGGYDESATTTPVYYVPVTQSLPASEYWSIDHSITYGTETILPLTSGVVDTGTTLILLATDVFQKYQSLTGATLDSSSLLTITPDQYAKLQPLTFHIGNKPFVLSPNAQILPRSATGGTIYLVVSGLGNASIPNGIDAILGYTFLERYYSVFDTTNHRIGFAETKYTFVNSN